MRYITYKKIFSLITQIISAQLIDEKINVLMTEKEKIWFSANFKKLIIDSNMIIDMHN